MTARQISRTVFLLALGLAAGIDLDCPPLWTGYRDHCYRFFGPPKTWQAAEEHCQEFFTRNGQGHLASIHSSGENNLLLQMWTSSLVPNDNLTGGSVALGLNDLETEGVFTWSDETDIFYSAWLDGQPTNWQGREDCGSFWRHDGQTGWNDHSCDLALPYICKMPTNRPF